MLEVVFQRARILNPLQIVRDGAEAIDYIRGTGAYSDRKVHPYPILFLLDLKMPRKGGMDVLRWLNDNPPQPPLPVVVTAGAGEMREVNCAYSLGARSFLVKPLTWLDVMELLSCCREFRLAAQGEHYAIEPVQVSPSKPLSAKPTLNGYKPQPLDTSRLKLTDDILRLTELLAENNHEVWARDRIAQGWTYGPKRHDEKKEHPCLVPYRDLPESEKLVDRNVALENIKTIFSFGLPYPVLDKATDSVRAEVIGQTLEALRKDNLTPHGLRLLWEEHNSVVWAQSLQLYRYAMTFALQIGEAFFGFEIAAEGLKKFQDDVHLRQMQALALARTGALRAANHILEELRSLGEPDVETLGLLARTYKDFWALATDTACGRRYLKLSVELYGEAYRRQGTYVFGINTAATGLLYGETENACQIAKETEQMCRTALDSEQPAEERCRLLAAMAQALLIQGDLNAAEKSYRASSDAAGDNWRPLIRARSEARLLLERTGRSLRQLDSAFKLPRIVVFSGPMFDKPEQPEMQFPFGLEARLRERIRQRLAQLEVRIGFSSLSSGAEMLFAEAVLERGGELNIILPCNRQEFKTSRVDIIPGAQLAERFDQILAAAASVTILEEGGLSNDPGVQEYCYQIMIGRALLQGRSLNLDVTPVAVETRAESAEGETFIKLWESRHTPVERISLNEILHEVAKDIFIRQKRSKVALPSIVAGPERSEVSPHIVKAVLFADIIGHTALSQQQLPNFIQHFLAGVSALLDSAPKQPVVRNTWGDTIHVVFDHVSEAGNFALTLQEFIQRTDWGGLGLPAKLSVRIALHAGPVYPCVDPVSRTATFLGPNLNQATRIEPLAQEGQIYATETFAALSEGQEIKGYICDYVGQKQLPNRYGTVPVFLVRRTSTH